MTENSQGTGAIKRLAGSLSSVRNNLIRSFGVMVVAMTIGNALNYLFSMIMTRMLGKAGSFGEFYSLNSLFLIVGMAAGSIQIVITKYVAEFEAKDEREKTRLLIHKFSRWLIYAGVVLFVVSVGASWPLARVLKLDSPLFVIIVGSSLALGIYITLPFGLLQGRQEFIALGVAFMASPVLRIVIGVVLVLAGAGVYGALGSSTIAAVLVVLAVVFMYRGMFQGKAEPIEDFHPLHTLWFLLPVAVTTFFIIFMTQVDTILVKALFSPMKADTYSYAALAGKAVLFFPEGILIVMFPKVSELRAKGLPTKRVLAWSLAAVAVMVSAVAGFFALFPNFTGWFFAGEKGRKIAHLAGPLGISFITMFGVVMAVFAIVKLIAFYHLAIERKAFIIIFLVASVVEVAGILVFGKSLSAVLTVMLVVGLALLAANIALAFMEEPGEPMPGEETVPPEDELITELTHET